MPGLVTSRSASPSSQDDTPDLSRGSSVNGDYPPVSSFPGYAEKPLHDQLEPIAVVGMGCRLPGDVGSPADFWDMMMNKKTGNTPKVPASRFNIDAHYHKNNDRPGSFGVLGGYFLNDDLANFDPGFFGITPIEAMWMDPQQRKLLEVVYEALESGGITLDAISGSRTAVFAASFTADWQQMSFKEHSFRHSLAATGVDPGIISNRISHIFNLNGPSIVCNTACSSSVYALHNACNALRNKEAEAAIVGGVNLIITVDQHMNTAKLGVLSPTSTCHTFDEGADGYGRADAVGAVYLKRLSDAVRDGDPIRGVIRSSAVNSNGKVPAVGITHPNREGQADVIAHAYKRGGDLDPRLTGYFECHGTGTAIGDPLEVHAVSMAMNKDRKPENGDDALWIGAVKTNIGHSEAASGLSALIKGILIVERGIIPPTRGVVTPNPKIKWNDWAVKVVTEPTPFPEHLPVRRVSINSFGYGGTNAHVIVEGAGSMLRERQTYKYCDGAARSSAKSQAPRRALHRRRPFLLPFAAHDKATLKRNIDAHGRVADMYSLLDLSYTLANRRSVLSSKAFTVANHNTLHEAFANVASSFTFAEKKTARTVGFVFTGQGAQWARMGAELIEYCPRFLQSIRVLDMALEELNDGPEWSMEDVLLEPAESSRVNDAEFSQPLCTAIQIALVQLLEFWGIRPVVTVGHSSGEIAAAYAAGLISAREAITVAYYRGKVTRDVDTDGAMMAVGLGAEAVESYLAHSHGKVVVACHNSPASVTLSGDADALRTVQAKLDAKGIFARMVKTNGKAYHSHHMAPVSHKYEKLVRAAKSHLAFDLPTPTTAKMVSTVTNAVVPEMTVLDHAYWSRNLRSPVLFNQAVQTILTSKEFANLDLLIEIGPHSAMDGPIKQIKSELKAEKPEYLSTLLRGTDSAAQLLKLAGNMFLRSYPMDMERVTAAYIEENSSTGKPSSTKGSVIVDLPPYQWNYTRPFWAEARSSREQRLPKFPRHDVLGQVVIGSSLAEPTWRNVLRARDLPWLKDHSLGGEAVFPAAGYFSMAIEAITQLNELSEKPVGKIDSYVLRDVSIKKALVTPDDDDGIEVLFNIRPSVYGEADTKVTWYDFSVSSIDANNVEKEHMAGSISINTRPRGKAAKRKVPQFPQRASGKAWNDALRAVGFDYGPTFQDMDDIRFDGKHYEASCKTNIKQHVDESLGESRYVLHPASVDSTLQLSIAAIYSGRTSAMDCGVVPIQVDEVTIWPPTESQLQDGRASAYAWVDRRGIRAFENSVQMTAEDGEMVMEVINVRTTSYEAAVPQKAEVALQEAPYGEMSWERDFDTLKTDSDVEGLTATDMANLFLFKYPDRNILELGFRHALDILQKNPRASYTIVATSDEEKDAATAAVAEYRNAQVVKLDTDQDVDAQSIEQGSTDMFITTNKTPSAVEILPQLRDILKQGGQAIWDSPAIGTALHKAGFRSFDSVLNNSSGTTMGRNTAPSEHGNEFVPGELNSISLVFRKEACQVAAQIQKHLEASSWEVGVCSLSDCADSLTSEHFIILDDVFEPLLLTVTEHEIMAIKNIANSASSILWITPGGFLDGKQPEYAMVSGLVRAITSEQASLDFRTLDFDLDTVEPTLLAATIGRITREQLIKEESPEREVVLSGVHTYISRLIRAQALNGLFGPLQTTKPMAVSPEDRIAGVIQKGKVVFQEQIVSKDYPVKPGYVEVQVQCSGLTSEGFRVITGADYPTTFSHEIGGIVKEVGPGVTNLKVGDRVVGFHADRFASHQRVPIMLLHKLEAKEDMTTAVSTLMAYAAAVHGLQNLARVRETDTVLVLNGTGTSGAAAVKIAQSSGAVPYVVARTQEEVQFLQSHLGLNAEHIIRPEDDLVSEYIKTLTDGHGADVVFSTGNVSPSDAREAWRSIARFGRFIDGGRKDVLSRKALDTLPVQRSASYMPFDLLDVYETHPDILSALLQKVVSMFREGLIVAPGAMQPTNLADLDQAVSGFSTAFGAAKPVILHDSLETPIIQTLPARMPLRFNPEATYLLVGCLGGLGRSLTSWMMESGARRFTFLSRSGADSASASKLVSDIEAAGAVVDVVRGDATSEADVVRAVQGVAPDHPIKGVVHAAMVLRDGMFHSMTFGNWKTSIEPKVLGAGNLHKVLASTPLDFFIMTSSISGTLGTPGQSNYAAANSYLDMLARHRRSAQLPATSLVLPMVLGVGVVAENNELEESLKRKGMYGIDEEKLLEAFEAAVISQAEERVPDHIVIGFDPSKLRRAISDAAASDSFWLEDARFSHVVHDMKSCEEDNLGGTAAGGQSILATAKAASTPTEAVALLTEHFISKLSRMLLLSPDEFEPDARSIADYGIDSMIGAELRNWIFKEYMMDIPFQQLLAATLTITKFATQVCKNAGISE
ncbi:putative polyketide synthase [Pseudomassariella vexata]|uniref:Putative polyketide synthase n=1 Tax=Pseudomassariella vexata TaxID=1141098 RepID=A0A1Y2EDG2_9PEZI|nr:putative polyketide synthase [Pseudomassariella vexata]ORY69611.1 putative polyketide synthase [Pseudomassariella vexata]